MGAGGCHGGRHRHASVSRSRLCDVASWIARLVDHALLLANRRLAVAAAVVEAATSWAVAALVLLVLCGGAKLAAVGCEFRAAIAERRITRIQDRFYARAADVADRIPITPEVLQAALRSL